MRMHRWLQKARHLCMVREQAIGPKYCIIALQSFKSTKIGSYVHVVLTLICNLLAQDKLDIEIVTKRWDNIEKARLGT